jgi:hypothetical protein
MRARVSFGLGSVVGGLAALLVAASLRTSHAGDPRDVRLLVTCDGCDRTAILDALRPLRVSVLDLVTMQPVVLGGPGLEDVAATSAALVRVVAEAARTAGEGARVTIRGLSLRSGRAHLEVGFAGEAAADQVDRALRTADGLHPTRVERGMIVALPDGRLGCAFQIFLEPTSWTGAAPSAKQDAEGQYVSSAEIRRALRMLDLATETVSSEKRSGGIATISITLRAPSLETLMSAVAALNGIPGHRATALDWGVSPGAGPVRPAALDVSVATGR